jgi:hypothetical protein
MEEVGCKVLIAGAVYIVFIVLLAIYRARHPPSPMRSRRARLRTTEAAGFATSEAEKTERRLSWIRTVTTALVVLSFMALALMLYLAGRR